jgi:hypothetical protein
MNTFRPSTLIPMAAVAVLASCASVPPPTAELATGRSAIDSAQQAGAPQFAPVELALARSKLESAESAMRAGRHDEARRFAEAAAVDASLAQARADSARARVAAQQVDDSIRTLRSELERGSPSAPPGAPVVTPVR